MFIRPETPEELEGFEPDFTVINCCSQVDNDWVKHNLHSDTAVVINVEEKKAVIFGTWYGGENKKGLFSLMNYWLPMAGHFPMHCSANVGKKGDVTLFFGLSGTGKTTLSADPHRALIGDDEHGWDDDGVFNFEGGCYAKTINLTEKTEPDIYRAIHKDALLENVTIKPDGTPDYFNTTKTENGRVSYPIFHIDGYVSYFCIMYRGLACDFEGPASHTVLVTFPSQKFYSIKNKGLDTPTMSFSYRAMRSECCPQSLVSPPDKPCTNSSPATPPRWLVPNVESWNPHRISRLVLEPHS